MYPCRLWALLTPAAAALLCITSLAPAIAEEISPAPLNNSAIDVTQLDLEGSRTPEQSLNALNPASGLESQDNELPTLSVEDISNAALFPEDVTADSEVDTVAPDATVDQVTSVSQLTDVEPTDWAFQALQNLVERYGCIAGYPDGTYRGNRALTRYEFAAGVNACLDRITELIGEGSDTVTQEDLASIQRLQEEFAAELASLRGRVDNLEARTAELEANQFSTTTVLRGLTWFNVTGAFADDSVRLETSDLTAPSVLRPAARDANGRPIVQEIDDDPEITFSFLTWLNLSTSFTGEDNLVVQLAVGNGDSPANEFVSAGLYNTWGIPFTDQTAAVEIGSTQVIVREFFYSFPIGDSLQAVVGPRVNWYRYFDNNRFTFFLTGASSFNSGGSTLLNTVDRGSGAVLLWEINDQFRLNVGYLGENDEFLPEGLFNTSSNPDEGLFGGTNTITAEVTFSPSNDFNLRLLYNRANLNAVFGQVGNAPGEPIYGLLDDGEGGPLNDATADVFSANFDWLITSSIGIFARYAYSSTHIEPGDVDAQAFQAGVAFLDLGKEGSQLTLSYLLPFSVLDGHEFLVSGGGDRGVQYEFEATYFYPLTDNIAIVPAFYLIGNPNNFSDNPNVFVGNLRTQFSF